RSRGALRLSPVNTNRNWHDHCWRVRARAALLRSFQVATRHLTALASLQTRGQQQRTGGRGLILGFSKTHRSYIGSDDARDGLDSPPGLGTTSATNTRRGASRWEVGRTCRSAWSSQLPTRALRVDHPRFTSAHFCSRSRVPCSTSGHPGSITTGPLLYRCLSSPENALLDHGTSTRRGGGPVLVEGEDQYSSRGRTSTRRRGTSVR